MEPSATPYRYSLFPLPPFFVFLHFPFSSLSPRNTSIVTWGEIEGTPLLLDPSATPAPPSSSRKEFTIPATPAREQVFYLCISIHLPIDIFHLMQPEYRLATLSRTRSPLINRGNRRRRPLRPPWLALPYLLSPFSPPLTVHPSLFLLLFLLFISHPHLSSSLL